MFQRVTFDTQRIGGSIQDEDEIQYPRPLLYTFFYLILMLNGVNFLVRMDDFLRVKEL